MMQKILDLKQLNTSAIWDTNELFSVPLKKVEKKGFCNNDLKLQQW